MEKKEYPTMEKESGGCMMAAEPAVTYAAKDFQCVNKQRSFDYPKDYDPGIGPYSLKEMNARIDKVERDKNNSDKWIRVDDFWAAMQKEHIWLR